MANRSLVFEDRPSTDLPGLQSALKRLVQQLGDGATAVLLKNQPVNSAGTPIRHGLRTVPRGCIVVPLANNHGVPFPYRDPDLKNVYVQAVRGWFRNTIRGRNGAGAVTCVGLVVGDTVENVVGLGPTLGVVGAVTAFETTITVADQIQQSSALDLTSVHYLVTVRRAATLNCDLWLVA